MSDQAGPRRVVIIGGGFAGLFAARALRRAPVQVTLIDRAAHHLFQPLLYQCSTGILSEGKITAPLRELLRKHRNVECVLAEVTSIDPVQRQVHATRPFGEQMEFGYWWFAFTRDLRRERTYTVREVGIVRDVYAPSPPTPPTADGS
jgi:NADH dehydrogenase